MSGAFVTGGDAVITTDAAGRVLFVNAAAASMIGCAPGAALGAAVADVVTIRSRYDGQPVQHPAGGALAGIPSESRVILIARDGVEHPIDVTAAPVHDPAGATTGAVLVLRDVGERRRTDEARARLAAIIASSDDAILSKSLDGVIRTWNAGATRLFGYAPEEAIGRSVTMLIPQDRLEEETRILDHIRRGVRVETFETIRVRKDGTLVDVSITVSPIKDEDGAVIGASKIARDITDRKRAQTALRASELRHRFLADFGGALQPLGDADAMVATTTRMLAEHLGVDRCVYADVEDEALVVTGEYARSGSPIATLGAAWVRRLRERAPFVVDDVEVDARVACDVSCFRRAGMRAAIVVPLHEHGRLVAALAVGQSSSRPWTADEVALVRIVAARSWESVTRARVTRGLIAAGDRLALALASARLGDFSWDAATDRVTLSARAAEIWGVPVRSRLTWAELLARVHPADAANARQRVAEALAIGGAYDVEHRVVRADGEGWIASKGRAHRGADGAVIGLLGVVSDVTERRHLEDELRRRARELAEADHQKDEFIALLAHELRNPLAPVRTGLSVIRLAEGDAAAVAGAREMMERQLTHMVRIIDDLLDVSRMSRSKLHLKRAPVTVAEVVRHALEGVAPAMEAAGHELVVSIPEEPIALDADLTRLAQVLGNLLANSAKYTPPGGHITLSAARDGRDVVIVVEDTGIGIPKASLPRVFDMFAQVDRSVERATGGLGIGLALVKGLVETHGGTVRAESEGPGRGSRFTVRLPVLDAAAPAAPVARAEPPRQRKRVLVADDNADGAMSMAALLDLLGNEVHVAHDGVEAVETAERVRPEIVLMDVGMPRMDGLEATRQIREQPWGRSITIIALTGWGQSGDRERSREAGCDGHLVKPVGLPELEGALAHPPRA